MNRKVLLGTMAALLLTSVATMVSCTKDDDTQTNQNAILVNTAALYDELGIRDEMSQALASGDYVLTDTLLIYDASGSLVKKLGSESNNLNPQTFEAEGLTDGSYTVVLWQTARSASGERVWKLQAEGQLSTAILGETRDLLSYAFSAGYASATVSTKGGKLVPTLTPMAIGCIIDLRMDNLNAITDATSLSLWGTNIGYYTGIRLAPAMDEDGRWYTDPDSTLIGLMARVPMGQASGKFFTLYHGWDNACELWVDKGTDEEYLTHLGYRFLPLGKQSVVYFDLARRNWQPPFCGSSEAFTTWKADRDALIPVTNPLLRWGCSIDDMYDHIYDMGWFKAGNYDLDYWEDPFESWHHWFYVSPRALTEQYLFETEEGENLRYVQCYCWDRTAPAELRNNLLLHQGFHATGNTVTFDGENWDQFLSADGQTEALASFFEDGYWCITYHPVNNQR